MQVTIRTESQKPKCQSEIKLIDWNDSSDRKWLMNHLHWAMHNEAKVTLNATNGYDRTIHEIASRHGFGETTVAN